MTVLTLDAVLALAPDAASAKAAQGLVAPAQWPTLGANEAAAWGECQGSGSKPYQTQVDLAGPAFRCTCPSRKFPCKHGLALLLLRAQHPAHFQGPDAPAWVTEWLASRADKAQKKEASEAKKAEPADPQAAAAREIQRWQRIEGAAAELQRWMTDQLARGLGSLDDTARAAWQTQARRLVDAQAPGLAQRLLDAAEQLNRGSDWPERTLARLGLLQLACEGLLRREQLPSDLQAELRVVAGWPLDKAEVLAQGERVTDRWSVLGVATEEREAKLTERRVWLLGQQSGRRALILDHAFAGKGFELAWLPALSLDATLAFFPGASRLRALVAELPGPPGEVVWPLAADEWQALAERVAASPWTPLHPLVLHKAVVLHHAGRPAALHQGRRLVLDLSDIDTWQLLATTGGQPVHLIGEWDGQVLTPLSAWREGQAGPVWLRASA